MIFKKILELLLMEGSEKNRDCNSSDAIPSYQKMEHYIPYMVKKIGLFYVGEKIL
jgi:hypothetical protein